MNLRRYIFPVVVAVLCQLTGCAQYRVRAGLSYTGEHGESVTLSSDGKTAIFSGGINGLGATVALPLPEMKRK